MQIEFTKECLVDILQNEDYHRYVRLHPAIWHQRDMMIDQGNIFSADGTQLTNEQIEVIHGFIQPWSFVLVYTNKSGEKQAFFNYHNGTNGKEGDVVKAMWDAHRKLNAIKKNKGVKWTTLLHYDPDHCDDVYSWFITFTLK